MDPERPASAEELIRAEALTQKRRAIARKGTIVLVLANLLLVARMASLIMRKPMTGWLIVAAFTAVFVLIGYFLLWQLALQMQRDITMRMVREHTGPLKLVMSTKNNYGETVTTLDAADGTRFISRELLHMRFKKDQTVRIVYLPQSKAVLDIFEA